MRTPSRAWSARCACGQTQLVASGAPLLTLACYCDDCQEAGRQISCLPNARTGLAADGGTVSTIFRKDMLQIARGRHLLVDHKLRPASRTTRRIASCCNSNLMTVFSGSIPIVTVRSFSDDSPISPELCVLTKFAPDLARIAHPVPKYAAVPANLVLKVLWAGVALRLRGSLQP